MRAGRRDVEREGDDGLIIEPSCGERERGGGGRGGAGRDGETGIDIAAGDGGGQAFGFLGLGYFREVSTFDLTTGSRPYCIRARAKDEGIAKLSREGRDVRKGEKLDVAGVALGPDGCEST